MVKRSKLYEQLDLLETELNAKIVPHLKQAANGENDLIFCVDGFNPFKELKGKTDINTEYLVELGAQILVLKKKLGEPAAETVAERICWYCREWGVRMHNEEKCAQILARQFLSEIEDKLL